MTGPQPLLSVEGLSVRFRRHGATFRAVDEVSLAVERGKVLCLLGESGCGKTATLRAIMRLLPPRRSEVAGRVLLNGEDVLLVPTKRLNALRGAEIGMTFQEAALAFDPVYRVGDQIVEALRRHEPVDRRAARSRALEFLDLVQIPSPERCFAAYPHELSGGMCQRAMIALALACRPSLLLADEPTTALDATVQIQILILLRRIQRQMGMSIILVTHDIGVAAELADRVAVMYAGRIVEIGAAREVLRSPRHPYTQGLLASTSGGLRHGERLCAIPGTPPELGALPEGCSFAPRCSRAMAVCWTTQPVRNSLADGRDVYCHLPAVEPLNKGYPRGGDRSSPG